MTAYKVQYLVAALARDAAIPVHLTPHGLRHSAITVGLVPACPYVDMQDFARHADPKTTRRYDRSRHALNRHALNRHVTYTIAHYLAGGGARFVSDPNNVRVPSDPVRGTRVDQKAAVVPSRSE